MLFDREIREKELECMRSRFMEEPRGILVILGPHDCGKSAILSHCLSEDAQKNGLGAFGSYMNGRAAALTDPAVFAKVLLEQQEGWVEWAKSLGATVHDTVHLAQVTLKQVKFGVGSLFAALTEKSKQSPEPKLPDVLEIYLKMLKKYSTQRLKGSYPVICLDEANILTAWQSDAKRQEDLGSLMRFLVKVSKEDNQAHVVLASSDSGFLSWIQSVAPAASIETQVFGNFKEHLARDHFENTVMPNYKISGPLAEDDWSKLYETVGGNAGLLVQATRHGSEWQKGINSLTGTVANLMTKGFAGAASFTPRDYAKICLQIVDGRSVGDGKVSHSLVFRKAQEEFGSKSIGGMIAENLLYYRPYSDWSEDVDEGAFGQDKEAVLMLPNAIFLKLAKNYKAQGHLDHYIQRAAAAPQPTHLTSEMTELQKDTKSTAEKIDKVTDELAEVTARIDELGKEIKKLTKEEPAQWLSLLKDARDERVEAYKSRDHLRTEKEQLRRKEEQLNERHNILLGRP